MLLTTQQSETVGIIAHYNKTIFMLYDSATVQYLHQLGAI
ncbi:hypothetical protein PAUR_b1321 [Pseudoalteromonas aurantia 208]|uniref:Uncharacterized protein n=1 Tax=Pseudoalteromonas aurantia 208 TaxID=1314867 RepID=A0ABR9EN34_9GAMM|nr:hypothetical protein [Pseudoalteromonas aurantia 208]